ncbi:MAG: hypothetical protein QM725_08090 [Lacibacter sp.]
MKKLLLAFAILGFVACNNEGDVKTTTDTATVAPVADTTAPVADTTAKTDTAAAAPVADTTKK